MLCKLKADKVKISTNSEVVVFKALLSSSSQMRAANLMFPLHHKNKERLTKSPHVLLLTVSFVFSERVLSSVRRLNEMLIFTTNQLET